MSPKENQIPNIEESFQTLEKDQVKTISPFLGYMNVHKIELGSGRSRVHLKIRPEHTNRSRTVHGGVIATLLDVAFGSAATSVVDTSEMPITVSLNVDYIQSAKVGESLVAEGKVVKKRSRLVFVEAIVSTDKGEVVARGSAVMAVRSRQNNNAENAY